MCTYSSVPSSSPSGLNKNSPIYVFKDGNLITVCSTCLGPFSPPLYQGNPNVGPRAYVKVEKGGEGRKHYLSSHPPKTNPEMGRGDASLFAPCNSWQRREGRPDEVCTGGEGKKESSCRSREGK